MNVTRVEEAVQYKPPKHYDCYAMHLQHKNLGCEAPYWVGCSYFLPGGKAEWDASPLDKIYIVLDGEITVEFEDETVKLGPMDSIWIGPGENREARNETNRVATMLVVMPYPPA
jgi:mannose-6-phosphate isomerase-like protein (cupin superfamily)